MCINQVMNGVEPALLRLLSEVTSLLNTQEDSVDLLQVLENQLELVYRELACLEILGILTDRQVTALNLTGQALDEVSTIANTNEHLISRYTPVIELGSVGRPRYYIPQSQLEYLLLSKFSIPQIALLLNVSVRTIGGEWMIMVFLYEVYMLGYLISTLMQL